MISLLQTNTNYPNKQKNVKMKRCKYFFLNNRLTLLPRAVTFWIIAVTLYGQFYLFIYQKISVKIHVLLGHKSFSFAIVAMFPRNTTLQNNIYFNKRNSKIRQPTHEMSSNPKVEKLSTHLKENEMWRLNKLGINVLPNMCNLPNYSCVLGLC